MIKWNDDLKIYASILRLTSIPFNITSIINSLGFIDIGINGTYCLIFGILLLLISGILLRLIKNENGYYS